MITMTGAWVLLLRGDRSFCPGVSLLWCFTLIPAASSSKVIHLPTDKLPLIAQRTLSFLPGDWSEDALESAKASNEFRQDIQDVYMKEYL